MARTTSRPPLIAVLAGLCCLITGLARPPLVAADALYPGDSAGTWAFGEVCEDDTWSATWNLWYILNDAMDYEFDDPDPDLVPGQAIRVDLAPAVIGPGLRGHLTMTGVASVAGTIPATPPTPEDTMWQGTLSDAEFGLAWEPDPAIMSIGVDATLPDGWAERYIGALGFEATITSDTGESRLIMFAQPISDCSASPTPSATPSSPAPSPFPVTTLPPTDATAAVGDPGAAPWSVVALVTLLLVTGAVTVAVTKPGRR